MIYYFQWGCKYDTVGTAPVKMGKWCMFMVLICLSLLLIILACIIIGLLMRLSANRLTQSSLADGFVHLHESFNDSVTKQTQAMSTNNLALQQALLEKLGDNRLQVAKALNDFRQAMDTHQIKALKMLQDSLQSGRQELALQVTNALNTSSKQITTTVDRLTKTTDDRLKEINKEVGTRLNDGFEKSTKTFIDVMKRLTLIDEAQKKMAELSQDVGSLKNILTDKRSRGAFGEVQLAGLIRNVLPENSFALQYTLPNDKRADCILFLPKPTGNMVIDAKFPLENYQKLVDLEVSAHDKKNADREFRRDIKTHIQDIADKYILDGVTAEGAIMFIPAEAIFAEIHAHFPDLVEASHRAKVWLASPTTMMAILTTVRAVLKDDATKKQVHIIQKHLKGLAEDFNRFQKRMDGLERHIDQAHTDVKNVNVSAKKITSRFDKIEQVELQDPAANTQQIPVNVEE